MALAALLHDWPIKCCKYLLWNSISAFRSAIQATTYDKADKYKVEYEAEMNKKEVLETPK